jgi:alanyl-tRNA synthetase
MEIPGPLKLIVAVGGIFFSFGYFALLQEEGVARGVRRITATTGALAKEAMKEGDIFQRYQAKQAELDRKMAEWEGAQAELEAAGN